MPRLRTGELNSGLLDCPPEVYEKSCNAAGAPLDEGRRRTGSARENELGMEHVRNSPMKGIASS